MSTTGAKAPTAAASVAEAPWSDEAWANPAYIYGAGEASVTGTGYDAGDQTEVLKAYTFDFSAIPTSAIIDGVICRINARSPTGPTAPAAFDLVQLLDVSRAKVGTNKCASPQGIAATATDYTFGTATDKWDNVLTAAWVKDADFGVAIGCLAQGTGNNNVDVYIDTVTLEVYYHLEENVYSNFGVSDAGSTLIPVNKQSSSSNIGVKDTASVTVLAPTPCEPNSYDKTGVKDSASLLVPFVKPIKDQTFGLSDVSTVTVVGPYSTVDDLVLTWTETPTISSASLVGLSEFCSVIIPKYPQGSQDIFGLSDVATVEVTGAAVTLEISPASLIGLSDVSQVVVSQVHVSVSDTVGVSDASTVLLPFIRSSVFDTVGISEYTLVVVTSSGLSTYEKVGLSDVATVMIEGEPYILSNVENVGISESVMITSCLNIVDTYI